MEAARKYTDLAASPVLLHANRAALRLWQWIIKLLRAWLFFGHSFFAKFYFINSQVEFSELEAGQLVEFFLLERLVLLFFDEPPNKFGCVLVCLWLSWVFTSIFDLFQLMGIHVNIVITLSALLHWFKPNKIVRFGWGRTYKLLYIPIEVIERASLVLPVLATTLRWN